MGYLFFCCRFYAHGIDDGLRIFWACDIDLAQAFFKFNEFIFGKCDVMRCDVFFEMYEIGCARNGDNPGFLGLQPGKGNLGCSGSFAQSPFFDKVESLQILFYVFRGHPGKDDSEVALRKPGVFVDRSGEEAIAEGAPGYKANAQFFAQG